MFGKKKNPTASETIEGEVRKKTESTRKAWRGAEEIDKKIVTFTVERFDEEGNQLDVVTVEISSNRGFSGLLSEGDKVILYRDKVSRSGVVEVEAVRNLTSNTIYGDQAKVDRGKASVPPLPV